jgi:hypothetical protein
MFAAAKGGRLVFKFWPFAMLVNVEPVVVYDRIYSPPLPSLTTSASILDLIS